MNRALAIVTMCLNVAQYIGLNDPAAKLVDTEHTPR